MFATATAGYCVTPSRTPFSRLPSRASTIIRDVKRKSFRLKRQSCSSFRLDTTPGTFVRLCEDEVRSKYVEEIVGSSKKKKLSDEESSPRPEKKLKLDSSPSTPLQDEEDKENNNFVTPGQARSSVKRRCSSFFTSSRHKRRTRTIRNLSPDTRSAAPCTLMAGYMYKKSSSTRTFRRKYVSLSSSGLLSYFPTFQSYLDNTEGKHINLVHSTVKIPGKVGTRDIEGGAGHEMVLVSLDNKTWQFQLCSQSELEQWVRAIEMQISRLLSTVSQDTLSAETVTRVVSGNDTCADCGHVSADWASLNLGIVICIQCSGIHRNLGTHVSKVRSLRLDTWTETQLEVMRHVGNSVANRVWEHHLDADKKPRPESSRAEKEQFILSKYVYKCWLRRNAANNSDFRDEFVKAVTESDMETVLQILIHHAKDISQQFPFADKTLASLLLQQENLFISQLLAWFKGFNGQEEDQVEDQDILLHQPGLQESILL